MNEEELADLLASGLSETRPTSGSEGHLPEPVQAVRDLLANEAVWAEPEPGGAEALVAALEAGGGPRSQGRASRRWQARSTTLLGAAAAAVLLVLAATAVGYGWGSGDDGGDPSPSTPPAAEFVLAGGDLMPEASAVATVVEWRPGVAIDLDITGLPPAEPGTYYQGWVRGPDGGVSVGTFHMQGGDGSVELWSGVLLDGYPDLAVTLQEEGAGPESSGQVVLEGRVSP